ncbi:Growth-regulating factor 1 [Dendrobium catenatum]|uniref:Growth-regulating factor n=1 Tax=Dendrobium catenatum TaxID=906689 RepID=A0A2I0VCU0_9ASPA|nr:Growth-regulating factor 1 [Dendrobium catenatum]
MMMNEKKSSSVHLFTASQWQELEHQALIYKYMVSGIPIPSDFILPIRRSFLFNSIKTSPSLAFPPQSQLGWSCVQLGLGREAEDPEQGRCRRTDGKKWRCSKEAYPDSKYCERHMHRGKNRLRKQAQISLTTSIHTNASSSENPLQLKPMGMSSLNEANQKSYSLSKEEEEERQRPLRHFFNERPQKNKESQMELEEENTSYTKTQTAISFPKWF